MLSTNGELVTVVSFDKIHNGIEPNQNTSNEIHVVGNQINKKKITIEQMNENCPRSKKGSDILI